MEIFAAFGVVTEWEVSCSHCLILGYRLSERFIDLLMIKFDRTHTHRVNFDDFIQLCVVLQTLTASFRDKDADRDGVITVGYEEFLTMVFICNI